jgi:hypothetical protein
MPFSPADNLSLTLFCLFATIMASAIFYALRSTPASQKWAVWYAGLVVLFSALALSGAVANHLIPIVPMLFALLMSFGVGFSLSRAGGELAATLPLTVLIGFQGFRLPLELILHHWAETQTVPPTMTWTGQNYDIITGVIALIAAPFARNKTVAWLANTIGFILLLNVLRVVVLSSPFPFSWPLERPLMLAAHFPYVLIAPLFVLPA